MSRIHPYLNLNTRTGRLSCRSPNLQNQPNINDPYSFRKIFMAEPGNCFIISDYAQLELRILAYLTGCNTMINAFRSGGDFHSRTAFDIYPYMKTNSFFFLAFF